MDGMDAEYSEVTKEMSDFERQTTYKKNVNSWLLTQPSARLWVLKHLLNIQQGHQKKLLTYSGQPWETKQLQEVANGRPRKYRPLVAHDMEATDPTLRSYGKLLVDDSGWSFLPVEMQNHSLAMAALRATSRSACSLYQLEKVRTRGYPAKRFSVLGSDRAAARAAAEQVMEDRRDRPCTMDG